MDSLCLKGRIGSISTLEAHAGARPPCGLYLGGSAGDASSHPSRTSCSIVSASMAHASESWAGGMLPCGGTDAREAPSRHVCTSERKEPTGRGLPTTERRPHDGLWPWRRPGIIHGHPGSARPSPIDGHARSARPALESLDADSRQQDHFGIMLDASTVIVTTKNIKFPSAAYKIPVKWNQRLLFYCFKHCASQMQRSERQKNR